MQRSTMNTIANILGNTDYDCYRSLQQGLKAIREITDFYAPEFKELSRGLTSKKAELQALYDTLVHHIAVEIEAECDQEFTETVEVDHVAADDAALAIADWMFNHEALAYCFDSEFLEALARFTLATAIAMTPAVKAHNAAAKRYWERADRVYNAYCTVESAVEWLIETGLPRAAADTRIVASGLWVTGLVAQEVGAAGAAQVRRVLADARLANRSIRYGWSDAWAK